MRTLTPERKAILALMADGRIYTPSIIAGMMGKERTSITQIMQKMVATGYLTQPAYGRYVITEK